MTTSEVFEKSQTINSKLQKMCETGLKEENRNSIAEEVRTIVTQLCLAVVECQMIQQTIQPAQPVQRDLDVPNWL